MSIPEILLDLVVVCRYIDHPCPLPSLKLFQHFILLSDDRIGRVILFKRKVVRRNLDILLLIVAQSGRLHLNGKMDI